MLFIRSRLHRFGNRSLPDRVSPRLRATDRCCCLISQLARDLQPSRLNQGRKLAKPAERHSNNRGRDAKTRIHLAGMVPDGRGHASNVEFVFLQIAGIAVLADAVDFGLQFLKTSDGLGREPLQLQLRQNSFSLLIGHVREHDFANCCAVEWNRCSDARINAKLLG